MYYVYVLKSNLDGRLYVGLTKDITRRLHEHNSGRVLSTKGFRPWTLYYKESGFKSTSDARKREKQLKSGYGKEFLKSLSK